MTERISDWKTISIRQELIKEIEEAVRTGRYRSISEFVSEAIRLRLEEMMRTQGITVEKHIGPPAAPAQLLYTPKHTWAQITPEGNIRIGVSDYAQRHLKGIARIQADSVGKEVSKMEPIGVAETWMFMFDLYAPVSGKLIKVNESLKNDPALVNEDPYGKGWIAEIKPKNSLVLEQELKELFGAREYNKWIEKLEGRLRD
jgi:glycine cleavage system H protein